jgi:hypothetical protein
MLELLFSGKNLLPWQFGSSKVVSLIFGPSISYKYYRVVGRIIVAVKVTHPLCLNPRLPVTSSAILRKRFNFSELQFPQMKNGY